VGLVLRAGHKQPQGVLLCHEETSQTSLIPPFIGHIRSTAFHFRPEPIIRITHQITDSRHYIGQPHRVTLAGQVGTNQEGSYLRLWSIILKRVNDLKDATTSVSEVSVIEFVYIHKPPFFVHKCGLIENFRYRKYLGEKIDRLQDLV
jgi:hypothetical protein